MDKAVLLLKGRHLELTRELERQMLEAATRERFEAAARIRDQIRDLDAVREEQKMDLGDEKVSRDLIAVARDGKLGAVTILEIRDGYVIGRKQFEVACPLEEDEGRVVADFLKGYYLRRGAEAIPREIVLSHAPDAEEHMEEALRAVRGAAVDLEVPQKGEKRRQINLALENAKLQAMEMVHRRERKNRQSYMVTALQEDLGLATPPNRIEGFDISHLSGTDTVASQVVFVDGKPSKKDYRHYNVKTVEGIDDFASMREIIRRRLRRLEEDKEPAPDLLLIDGGKGQLGMAVEALREAGRPDQAVVGLAKRLEEVFIPGQGEPLLIAKTSASLKLLQQVRDEAHRFAITFQRSKRKKHLEASWLDEVPGIGDKTKMKLLRAFGSPAGIEAAGEAELAEAAGKVLAGKIRAYLRDRPGPPARCLPRYPPGWNRPPRKARRLKPRRPSGPCLSFLPLGIEQDADLEAQVPHVVGMRDVPVLELHALRRARPADLEIDIAGGLDGIAHAEPQGGDHEQHVQGLGDDLAGQRALEALHLAGDQGGLAGLLRHAGLFPGGHPQHRRRREDLARLLGQHLLGGLADLPRPGRVHRLGEETFHAVLGPGGQHIDGVPSGHGPLEGR